MTVNYSYDLEDNDFLDDTLRSIPENVLLNYSISSSASEKPLQIKELNEFQELGTSILSTINGLNTDCNRKNSLACLSNQEMASPSQKEIEVSGISSSYISINADEKTKINSRFVPGITPKAKKRKLPGPAGFFSENNDQQFLPADSEHLVTKRTTSEIEIQNITNSQFSSDDLLLSSWQKLQAEVSSCHNLLATAKYFSIRRVLHETSKKKLPKHLVVPVLCVLIKKFNAEESSLILMDDTGEISGKIDKELLDMYKDTIRERTALILKKVMCICNILVLKKQNIVSIYLEDGSVKHIQDLNSILAKEEPLKPMNCQCPGTPDEKAIKKPLLTKTYNSTPISAKKPLIHYQKTNQKIEKSSPIIAKNLKENNHNIKTANLSACPQIPIGKEKVLNLFEAMLDVSKSNCSSENCLATNNPNHTAGETLKSIQNVYKSSSCSTEIIKHDLTSETLNLGKLSPNNSKPKQKSNVVTNSSYDESNLEEDLFCENTDDFDDILCSLDEKSFLENI